MAFLEKADLSSVIRTYQLDAITGSDDTIVQMAIDAAVEEISSILTPNNQLPWIDGRPHYDVAAIFAAIDAARNPLILACTKDVALWRLIGLCNTGLDYTDVQDRYDRTTKYLNNLAAGKANSPSLPQLADAPPPDEIPFSNGSRPKFRHDY